MVYRELELTMTVDFSKLTSTEQGEALVPAIIVDRAGLAMGEIACIRMVGFMNQLALDETQSSGLVTFYTRTRGELWKKGESSGNVLKVDTIYVDCDNDTLLITVDAVGPTCHTGAESCFEELNDTI